MLDREKLLAIISEVEILVSGVSKQAIEQVLTNRQDVSQSHLVPTLLQRLTTPKPSAQENTYRSALWLSILPTDVKKNIIETISQSATTLDVSGKAKPCADHLAHALHGLIPHTAITSLNVSHLNFTKPGMLLIAALPVQKLKLKNNGNAIASPKIDLESMRVLANNSQLKTLDVSGNNLGPNAAAILAQSKTLLRLNISFNPIQFVGIATLSQMKLVSLNVAYTVSHSVAEEAQKTLQAIATMTQLRELKIAGLGLHNHHLSPLQSCGRLEMLDISGNAISILTPLMLLPGLKHLNVFGNHSLTNEEVRATEKRWVTIKDDNFPAQDEGMRLRKSALRNFCLLGKEVGCSAKFASDQRPKKP